MTDQMPIGTNSRSKPGPKPNASRAAFRNLHSEMSDRTFARYWKAHRRLMVLVDLGAVDGDAGYKAVVARAARPNGSFNVNKFDQITEAIAAIWVVQQEGGPA